jgi:hypothetical protein
VNPGGEPERDESGLPPVDIEIPDDARELDRDVQAYYRELRAERRQQRGLRVRGTLAKDGIILPLLACCLILALITGTLLTVFTATSDQTPTAFPGVPRQPARTPAASHAPANGPTSPPAGSSASPPAAKATAPGTVPGMLPAGATIAVGGQALAVQRLSRAALVLVPPHCNCTATVSWIIYVVTGAHAQPYLVYTDRTMADVQQLYASLGSTDRAKVQLAAEGDTRDLLRESIPATLREDSLAAILIGPKQDVLYATGLRPRDDATTLIQALTH